MEKQLTLFGENVEALKEIKRTRAEVFEDYEGFVKKFDAKKTTDDCYTPAPVYGAVLDFVRKHWDIEGRPVVRPFYPGGDYEAHAYPVDCVVVDNPPFSLLSKIIRFYCAHKVPFFLFGPSLTLFTAPDCDLTYILADTDIRYENGAVVRTGFITNLPSETRVWLCPELREMVDTAQGKKDNSKKGFAYPDNLITAATLLKIVDQGVELRIPKSACHYIKDSDSAKAAGRALFGGGYLLSDKAAAERAAAERAAAERAAAERAAAERARREKKDCSVLALSTREALIVQELNKYY